MLISPRLRSSHATKTNAVCGPFPFAAIPCSSGAGPRADAETLHLRAIQGPPCGGSSRPCGLWAIGYVRLVMPERTAPLRVNTQQPLGWVEAHLDLAIKSLLCILTARDDDKALSANVT